MKCDFSGYATKNDLKCSDGRVIRRDAFKGNDKQKVPLIWGHQHSTPDAVLGHVLLENRDDGVFAYGFFNETTRGKEAKEQVKHGDITSMSIWANNLVQKGSDVVHGVIREVSLVLAGANPGARIENVYISHSDGTTDMADDEAIISYGCPLEHGIEIDFDENSLEHADDKTIEEVFKTLSDEQLTAVYAVTTELIKNLTEAKHSEEEGESTMKKNVFADSREMSALDDKTLMHDIFQQYNAEAESNKTSLKQTLLAHAGDLESKYGITNIGELFPDPKNLNVPPEWIKRDTGWVSGVLNGVRHTPFSRIMTMTADITHDDARAKGYIKGNLKKEEYFSVAKRQTLPTTIYKKQKLDRNDIIDITSFDVVAWIRAEMRMMLEEEIARAVLIGDGREVGDEDKINEENIRPIWTDNELYALHYNVENGVPSSGEKLDIYSARLDNIIRAMSDYKGSGSPTWYVSPKELVEYMLLKDKLGRRMFDTKQSLASYVGVSSIVEVPQLNETLKRTAKDGYNVGSFETASSDYQLYGIIVNLRDYTIGADKGGQITSFDDFDIDYNQYKYLLETRISGCLTKPNSAIILERPAAAG